MWNPPLQRRDKELFTSVGYADDRLRAPTTTPATNRSNCHVDAKCGLSRDQLHAAQAQFADAYPRRRGLAADRQDAGRARRSQRTGRAAIRQIRAGLSQPFIWRDQPGAAWARGQRARAVRPGQAVLLDARLGPDSRSVVSARADAARFRRASPAPARAVGRLQVRADEILSCRTRYRDRGAGRAMEGAAGADAVLSRDETAHARSRRNLFARRRHGSRGR